MKRFLKKIIPESIKEKIKRIVKQIRLLVFKKEATHLSSDQLVKEFKKAGIQKGDALFIHSSLKGLGYIENGAITVIEALKQVVTEEGTLIFPTFTIKGSMYETLSDETLVFDPKSSASTVGYITNQFLKSGNVYRSLHPTHSVAAWGKHAEYITSNHYELSTNFGENTPFGKFLDLNGKVLG
ncbi:AAC(3) family N-acetyltransferase, partial [Bacteroidota bacterium]